MRTLYYNPKIEVYVAASSGYYDLSEDIISGSVTRNQDAVSTFRVKLSNKHGKYNGVFAPMDRVTIYMSKTKRYQVLTGYIGHVDAWTLYPQDFEMSGFCSLYRLQRMYWDPGLVESVDMVRNAYEQNANAPDAGLAAVAMAMLTAIGGMNANSISIESDLPDSTKKWAYGLYADKIEDMGQARDMVNAFYDMLKSAGPKIGSSAPGGVGITSLHGSEAQNAIVELYVSWMGRFSYSQSDGRLDPVANGYGDCSSTCWRAYKDAANIDCGTWTGDMVSKGKEIASGSGSGLPIDRMEPADLVLFNWDYYNPTYDHVEMYVGKNQFAGHGGPGNGPTLKPDACSYAASAHDWQVRRYVE